MLVGFVFLFFTCLLGHFQGVNNLGLAWLNLIVLMKVSHEKNSEGV